ncbi:MAG: PhoH family protein [Chitinophagales bacterium]|nr:PhoH family protein [Chitinophagales bacterium]
MASERKITRNKKAEQGGTPTVNRKAANWAGSNGIGDFKLTPNQQELANKIIANTLTFVDSPAGTGKSLTVLHTFVKEYLRDTSKRIVIIRTPVEAGGLDKLGFLPDDLASKVEPHFASTKRLLEQLLNKGKVETDLNNRIFFKVPNFELGATWDNSLVLIDEAQALQPMIMKLLLERIGVNTRVVVAGDSSQLYATDASQRNGLKDALGRFLDDDKQPKFDDIAFHRFTVSDVMRSEIVKTVITAYQGTL